MINALRSSYEYLIWDKAKDIWQPGLPVYLVVPFSIKNVSVGDLPGGQVVKTSTSNVGGAGSILG